MLKMYKFAGTIYGAPVDSSGLVTGTIRRVGNLYPLNLKVESETKKQQSMEHDRHGQTVGSSTAITDIMANGVLRQLESRSFAWAVAGAATEMTGEGGTVTPTSVNAPAPGDYHNLPNEQVSAFNLTNDAGDTTYAEGTDYILDAELGLWTPIEGGGITTGDPVKYDYTFAAESGNSIAIGTQPDIRLMLMGNLLNTATGEKARLNLKMVTVSSPDGINLISELDADYEELNLDFVVETPPGHTNPGTIDGVPL